MKAHPILFSAPMIHALLEGRKTQTRRIIKGKNIFISASGAVMDMADGHIKEIKFPYGEQGGYLWVRETWYCDHYKVQRGLSFKEVPDARELLYYRATDCDKNGSCYTGFSGETMDVPWNSSIHMPRWASRLTLKMTGMKVEQLQDISEADAKAEGVQVRDIFYPDESRTDYSYCHQFRLLWESINGEGSWDLNPWVWVPEFEVIKQNIDAVLKAAA
jgi:hypothetical protein